MCATLYFRKIANIHFSILPEVFKIPVKSNPSSHVSLFVKIQNVRFYDAPLLYTHLIQKLFLFTLLSSRRFCNRVDLLIPSILIPIIDTTHHPCSTFT